jgi:hypothetical protein
MSLIDKFEINSFSIESIDTEQLDNIQRWLPNNNVIDLNVAERGLVLTLHAQNFCQEVIVKIEILISQKESIKNKAWSNAALSKSPEAGHKTADSRSWFAQADDDYIAASNEVAIAKAAKKYFENKASLFENWHYAFKTFLKRDYDLEKIGNFSSIGYNNPDEVFRPKVRSSGVEVPDQMCGNEEDIWK